MQSIFDEIKYAGAVRYNTFEKENITAPPITSLHGKISEVVKPPLLDVLLPYNTYTTSQNILTWMNVQHNETFHDLKMRTYEELPRGSIFIVPHMWHSVLGDRKTILEPNYRTPLGRLAQWIETTQIDSVTREPLSIHLIPVKVNKDELVLYPIIDISDSPMIESRIKEFLKTSSAEYVTLISDKSNYLTSGNKGIMSVVYAGKNYLMHIDNLKDINGIILHDAMSGETVKVHILDIFLTMDDYISYETLRASDVF